MRSREIWTGSRFAARGSRYATGHGPGRGRLRPGGRAHESPRSVGSPRIGRLFAAVGPFRWAVAAGLGLPRSAMMQAPDLRDLGEQVGVLADRGPHLADGH